MPHAQPQVAESALASFLETLDFDQGQQITQKRHHQGEVRLFSPNSPDLPEQLIIKRPSGRGLRRWLNLITLKREHAAYRRLAGLEGFAQCYGFYSNQYLVLSPIEGKSLSGEGQPSEAFFEALLAIIQAMHDRGVAHGDLKKKDHIVVGPNDQPFILDLGTAVVRRPGWHPLSQAVFGFMRKTDLNAWVKHKYGGYDNVSLEDQRHLNRSWLERVLTYWRARKRENP